MSKNFHQSHSQVPAGFVAVVVRCQGGDPPGTGKAVRASMVVTLRTPWGDQWTLEDSEIWESPYNSTVVVDFIRKTCIYECPDPQHSGA